MRSDLEICVSIKRLVLAATLATALTAAMTPAEAGRRRPRPAATNTAPYIGGSPATSVQATATYAFTPNAGDADKNALAFSIANRPAWATFSSSTGQLVGTPTSSQAGTYSNIIIKVSDGYLSSYLPAFSITVTAPPSTTTTNTVPVISGTPPTSVTSGSAYSFAPRVFDADGNMLAFSIANKPAWAIFSTATGLLAGTPSSSQTGMYPGISISVTDGAATAILPSFSIAVNAPVVTGSAALSWTAPALNTDGSALTDLAGFRIYHGKSATSLNDVVQIVGPASTTYTYPQLSAGTHYFAVAAYSSSGAESVLSAALSKAIQ